VKAALVILAAGIAGFLAGWGIGSVIAMEIKL
jgi:hypothetical protein